MALDGVVVRAVVLATALQLPALETALSKPSAREVPFLLPTQGTRPAQNRSPEAASPGSVPHGGVQVLHQVSGAGAVPAAWGWAQALVIRQLFQPLLPSQRVSR